MCNEWAMNRSSFRNKYSPLPLCSPGAPGGAASAGSTANSVVTKDGSKADAGEADDKSYAKMGLKTQVHFGRVL